MKKTKPKEGEKRQGGGASSVLPALLGGGLAFGLVFALLLAVAALTWTGTLTSTDLPAALCAGAAALIGGRFAVRTGTGGPLPTALLAAGTFCGGLLALCVLYGGTVTFSRPLFSALLLALAGGGLAGLLGKGKARRRPGKR